ncbi:CLUMA_CG013641, isoform A [Clunio marinus]|uniref:CLUMA_CG013641, isoform A n=1 Tax=Clunio marinus TaxID=568069 RepID=A0A1J1IJF2_9DIPT|nr:CLUMA_CG013641, isoform A [Clunio marinus]
MRHHLLLLMFHESLRGYVNLSANNLYTCKAKEHMPMRNSTLMTDSYFPSVKNVISIKLLSDLKSNLLFAIEPKALTPCLPFSSNIYHELTIRSIKCEGLHVIGKETRHGMLNIFELFPVT